MPRKAERAPSAATTQSASDVVGALGRLDRERGAVVAAFNSDHLVAPADVEIGQLRRALHERMLEIILLEIDEGRHLVPVLGQKIEGVKQLVTLKDFAELPGHALLQAWLGNAKPIEDFERALGIADAARSFADPVGIVEQQYRHAALGEVDGRAQPDRARADDDDGMASGGGTILVRAAAIAELK